MSVKKYIIAVLRYHWASKLAGDSMPPETTIKYVDHCDKIWRELSEEDKIQAEKLTSQTIEEFDKNIQNDKI